MLTACPMMAPADCAGFSRGLSKNSIAVGPGWVQPRLLHRDAHRAPERENDEGQDGRTNVCLTGHSEFRRCSTLKRKRDGDLVDEAPQPGPVALGQPARGRLAQCSVTIVR